MKKAALALATLFATAAAAEPRAEDIRRKLDDPSAGIFVVAHRGCHNPAPLHGSLEAPENSLAALENCVKLGVDMMETDVRRAKDGTLMIVHDSTVDRTSDGAGRVADMTLDELKRLRLRRNFGGKVSPQTTDQAMPTLTEMLAAAKDRIMLNLDVKEAIYPEVVAAVRAAGMTEQALIKSEVADPAAPPMADQSPYRDALYMPILWEKGIDWEKIDVGALVTRQSSGRRRIPAVELVFLDPRLYPAVRESARRAGIRIWCNTLTSVGVVGIAGAGGDLDALRDRGRTWSNLIEQGVSIFQTDEPEALLEFLAQNSASSSTK